MNNSWNVAGSGTWSDVSAWSTGTVAGSGNYVTFNTAGLNADETIYLDGDRTITTGTFSNTGSTTLLGGVSDATASNTLTLSGSLVITAGAGPVVIGDSSAEVNLQFTSGSPIISNSSTLTIANSIYLTTDSTASRTLTIAGNGNTTILGNIATYNGVSTGTGSLLISNLGTTTLAGDNSALASVSITGSTAVVIAKSATALGSGTVTTTNGSGGQALILAMDSDTDMGVDLVDNGSTTLKIVADRATAGAGVQYSFDSVSGTNSLTASSLYTLWFQSGSNVTSGTASFSLGALNMAPKMRIMADGVTLSIDSAQAITPDTSNRNTQLKLWSNTDGNTIGSISDGTNSTASTVNSLAVYKAGSGTWIMTGSNNYSGNTLITAGTIELDYGSSNTNKLSTSGTLIFQGGAVKMTGGSYTQTVGSTTFQSGGNYITRTDGSSVLALGAITFVNGVVDFSDSNIATTTNTTTNGILDIRATVAGSDYATVDSGSNIVAYTDYTNLVDLANSSTVYSLVGSGSYTAIGFYGLKITTTGEGQSLTVSNSTSAIHYGSLLFSGSNDYTITTGDGGMYGDKGSYILNYATNGAVLYLNTNFKNGAIFSGTGKTVLTGSSSADASYTVQGGGKVQFSNNYVFGSGTSISTLSLNNGTLIADTTNGSFSLDSSSGYSRNINIVDGGGTIDVIGGNALTISGTIYTTETTAPGSVTFGSTESSGTIILTGTNTYTGQTVLAGGVVQLAAAEGSAKGPLGTYTSGTSLNTIAFTGGTLQFSSANTYDYSSRFSQTTGQSFKIDTNGQDVTFATGLVGANNTLSKYGEGTLTLSGTNTYGGTTSVEGGELDVNGSIASGTVSVTNNATLGGSGSVTGATVVNNGKVNGNGLNLAMLTVSGSSTLSGNNTASSVTIASGTTTLTGTTKATSALQVSAGATLNANGTIDGSATVSGLLKGNSTITGNLSLTSGTLSSGNSAGITTVAGDFTMDSSSTLVAEVSGVVAGTSYDQMQVSGNITLAGTLDLSTLSGLTLGDTITLIENIGSGTTTGYFSSIITSGSTYTASTSGSTYTFTVGSTDYEINYAANTDGGSAYNDVTLTVVPEPRTWVMLITGMGMWLGMRKLRCWKSSLMA